MISAALPLLAQSQTPAEDVRAGALGQAVRIPPAPTGPVPRLPDGTVDLSGLWIGGGPIQDMERDGGLQPGEIPLLPWANALMESRKENEWEDPHYWCYPMGVPRTTPYPWRFVQTPSYKKATHLFILFEGNIHSYRQIFVDGRKHPEDPDPTWFGHSIGWWEGDTLVIDTVGFNDKFWMDHRGHPHTEQLHIIERWTRKDLGHLENKVTIDDPGAYSKPFTLTFQARLAPPGDEIMENICVENNQYGAGGGHTNPYKD